MPDAVQIDMGLPRADYTGVTPGQVIRLRVCLPGPAPRAPANLTGRRVRVSLGSIQTELTGGADGWLDYTVPSGWRSPSTLLWEIADTPGGPLRPRVVGTIQGR